LERKSDLRYEEILKLRKENKILREKYQNTFDKIYSKINELSNEMLYEIFRNVDMVTLFIIKGVCKQWNDIINVEMSLDITSVNKRFKVPFIVPHQGELMQKKINASNYREINTILISEDLQHMVYMQHIIDKYYQRTVNILDYKRVIIKRYDCNRITEYNFTLFNDRLFITIDWNRNLFEIYFDSQLDTLTVEEIGLNNNIITLKFTNTETNKSITSNFLSPCDLKDTIEQTKLLKEFKLYAKSEEIYWDYVKKT